MLYCTYLQLGQTFKSVTFLLIDWLILSFINKWGKSLPRDNFPYVLVYRILTDWTLLLAIPASWPFVKYFAPYKMTEHYLDLAFKCHSMYCWKCNYKKPKLDQVCITCPYAILSCAAIFQSLELLLRNSCSGFFNASNGMLFILFYNCVGFSEEGIRPVSLFVWEVRLCGKRLVEVTVLELQ